MTPTAPAALSSRDIQEIRAVIASAATMHPVPAASAMTTVSPATTGVTPPGRDRSADSTETVERLSATTVAEVTTGVPRKISAVVLPPTNPAAPTARTR